MKVNNESSEAGFAGLIRALELDRSKALTSSAIDSVAQKIKEIIPELSGLSGAISRKTKLISDAPLEERQPLYQEILEHIKEPLRQIVETSELIEKTLAKVAAYKGLAEKDKACNSGEKESGEKKESLNKIIDFCEKSTRSLNGDLDLLNSFKRSVAKQLGSIRQLVDHNVSDGNRYGLFNDSQSANAPTEESPDPASLLQKDDADLAWRSSSK